MHRNQEQTFLQNYLQSFDSIEGWLWPDAALLFMAYNQLIQEQGITGDVLEIGVYHGLSSIGVAAMRGPGKLFYAVDLFDTPEMEAAGYRASKSIFVENFQRFYPDSSFLRLMVCASEEIRPGELDSSFTFCHIDGGHSAQETFHDLCLCFDALLPGGLLAIDDYFNPAFPGVSEGSIQFRMEKPGGLIPVAIGFNKVLFQKAPAPFDLNTRFVSVFDHVQFSTAQLWNQPVFHFDTGFLLYFDIPKSTPSSLVRPPGFIPLRARFEPGTTKLRAVSSEKVIVPVRITNYSKIAFRCNGELFGVSYHLRDHAGALLQWDNERTFFIEPLPPGETRTVPLTLRAPAQKGHYQIEIDMVWEGHTWFKDAGNPSCMIHLTVD